MNINIPTPDGFDLKRTTGSHGWSGLLPFEYVNAETLVRVLDVGEV